MFLFLLTSSILCAGDESTPTSVPAKVKCGLLFGCLAGAACVMAIIGAVALYFMNREPAVELGEYTNIE